MTGEEARQRLYFLRRLKMFVLGPKDLQTFNRGTPEIITARYVMGSGNCLDIKIADIPALGCFRCCHMESGSTVAQPQEHWQYIVKYMSSFFSWTIRHINDLG